MKLSTTLLIGLAIISIAYMVTEFQKPVSKETMIEVYETEKENQCYGEHEFHCNEYYDDIIRKINNS